MPGMKTLASPGISDYNNRTVTIEVSGVCQQSVMKTSNYKVQVAYSQMSQALQNINRQGGKVVSVQLMGNPPARAGTSAPTAEAPASEAEGGDEEKKSSKRKRR